MNGPRLVALHGCGLIVGAAAATWPVWRLSSGPVTALMRQETLTPEQAVVGICAAALIASTAWLVVAAGLVVIATVTRELRPDSAAVATLSALVEAACPALVRTLVATVVGVAVTAGVAGPVHADRPDRERPALTGLTGLAVPDRTTGVVAAVPPPVRRVLVQPGDSLWSIASALLPEGAPDRDVVRTWHALHNANTSRIGSDPDLIHPGTHLVVPALDPATRKEQP